MVKKKRSKTKGPLNSSGVAARRSCGSSNAISSPERAAADSDNDDGVDFTHTVHLTRTSGSSGWGFDVHPHRFPVCVAGVSPAQAATLHPGDTIVSINGAAPESFASAMLWIDQSPCRLALCVRRVPVRRPPTPPRPAPRRAAAHDRPPASAPASAPGPASASAPSPALSASAPSPALSAPAPSPAPAPASAPSPAPSPGPAPASAPSPAETAGGGGGGGGLAALALHREPRQAVYDRRGCPFGAADGLTDAFHDAVQRAMTRMALARPAEWTNDDAGDAVAWGAWVAQHKSAQIPTPHKLAELAAKRDAEIAAHAARYKGPGAAELAAAHREMVRAAHAALAAAERGRAEEEERLTKAEAAAAELRAAYEAVTAPPHAVTAPGRRRPRQNSGAGAEMHFGELPRPTTDADRTPRNARRMESGNRAAMSSYLRLPTPSHGNK